MSSPTRGPDDAAATTETPLVSEQRTPLARASDVAMRLLVLLALGALVVVAALWLSAVVVPALLAVVLAPVARPLEQRLARRLPGSLSAALVLLLAFGVLAATGWLIIASIAANWAALSDGISDAIEAAGSWIEDAIGGLDPARVDAVAQDVREFVASITAVLVGGVGRGVAAIGGFLIALFFFLMTFFFAVRDWDRFTAWIVGNAGGSQREKLEQFLDRYSVIMRRFWKGQALLGVFDAVAMGLGLWLIGVPLALPIAILTFVLSFIPYLGAIIAGALAVFVALGTSGSSDALLALLLSLVVFNTGENLVRPWLVGGTVKMSTFVAFLAGTLGVLVSGTLGAILAVPLVALVSEARRIYAPPDEAGVAGGPDPAR